MTCAGKDGLATPPPPRARIGPSQFLTASLGPERDVWSTLRPDRLVVAVTRNETTTAALLAVASSIFADQRVQVVFSVPPDRSAFSAELEDSLRARGLLVVPWNQVNELSIDLVVAASHAGAPLSVAAPTLILPHGYARTRDATSQEQARPGDLVGIHRVVHAAPHESAAAFLPSWGEVAVVGDPILDSLINSRTQATQTRRALGVRAEQKLVVITSTWRANSLFASRPTIFDEVLSEMPQDEYVVAAILHPNIWVGHGRWQTRTWMQSALEAGLRLISFQEGWRPTVASADLVLGDHGSVTFYADLLGKPVLRIYGALDELTPGTVLAEHVLKSPRLRPNERPRARLERLSPPTRESTAALLESSVRHIGQAYDRLRRVAYDLMNFDTPAVPVRGHRSTLPEVEWSEPSCHWAALVRSVGEPVENRQITGRDGAIRSASELVMERTPLLPPTAAPVDAGRTIFGPTMAARIGSALPADAQRASVLLMESPVSVTSPGAPVEPEIVEALHATLRRYPGSSCVVASAERTILVLHAGGKVPRRVTVEGLLASDEQAMTAAALLSLASSLVTENKGLNLWAAGSPMPMRCGATRWKLTIGADAID